MDHGAINQARPARRGPGGSPARLGWLALLSVLLWTGCSVEKHYELLSFFFDGVPDPNAPPDDGDDLSRQRNRVVYTIHEPYGTESCLECHRSAVDVYMTRADSDICMKCHEGVPDQYERMHGPVVGMACLWCHNPHKSPYPYLLRDRAPRLCQQCHGAGLMEPRIPEHQEPVGDCLACHSGHGGSRPYFLRSPAPETEETELDAVESDVAGES